MTAQFIHKELKAWLNSCITEEQINLVVEVAEDRLQLRLNENDMYNDIILLADIKKVTPAVSII